MYVWQYFDGFEKETMYVHQILWKSWGKCDRDISNTSVQERKCEGGRSVHGYLNIMLNSRSVGHPLTVMKTHGGPLAPET